MRNDVSNITELCPLKDSYFVTRKEYFEIARPLCDELFVIIGSDKCISLRHAMYHQSVWFSEHVLTSGGVFEIVPSTLVCCPLSGAVVVCEGYWDPTIYRMKDSCSVFSDDSDESSLLVPLLGMSINSYGTQRQHVYQPELSTWEEMQNLGESLIRKVLLPIGSTRMRTESYRFPQTYGCGVNSFDGPVFIQAGSLTRSELSGRYCIPGDISHVKAHFYCTLHSWLSLHPLSAVR